MVHKEIIEKHLENLETKGMTTINDNTKMGENQKVFHKVLRNLKVCADSVKATLHDCTIVLL